ncbi:NADH-quinone oxidoreductase subunit J [Halalkalicoccus subterraneus]|uniref:NADH-quinone oxidoreductase subunit J n=1 Tax=Halalkalicoccus subterraneus TaxID=2675002 RepID=UPI000EFD3F39|nr:NADH-quinone oxidoreductase subunit J [Halalkalicoccus subterraneus]
MVLETATFALFAGVTLASSLGVVLVRDVWHASLLLAVALSSVAIHYVTLHAEFLAAVQILVYIGGVLILITFAVMLTHDETAEAQRGTQGMGPTDSEASNAD